MVASPDGRALAVLLCAPLLGLLGVVGAELVPDGRIGYHLIRARDAGILGAELDTESPLATTVDRYTECTALSIGLGTAREAGLLTTALASPAYSSCAALEQELDTLQATNSFGADGTRYLRYWHGYATLTRPAVGLFGLAGARWLCFGVLAACVVAFVAVVRRAHGGAVAALLSVPALLTTDAVIGGLSLQQSLGIATAWAGGWIAFSVAARRPAWRSVALGTALAGALNAYVDLMTTIPGALALTATGATLGALAAPGSRAPRPIWTTTAVAVAGWAAGLTWMWASKWVLAAMVLGVDEVVDNVRSSIEFRLSGRFVSVSEVRTRGLTDVLGEWWHQPLAPWLVGGALIAVVAVLARSGDRLRLGPAAVCVAFVAVPVLAWYMALNNHTQIHVWLVYRSVPIAFGALCGLAVAVGRRA